jgi:hypothetical protein
MELVGIDKPRGKQIIFLITKAKPTNVWTAMEDKLLMIVAGNYGYRNWKAISSHFPGRSSIQCSARYKRIKPGYNKGLWSPKEDSSLLRLIKQHGRDWSKISKIMKNRTGKQIRDRFLNTLDSALVRGRFSHDEDVLIQDLYARYGSRWTTISKHLPGRSGDMIKNRFFSVLKNQQKEIAATSDGSCDSTPEVLDIKDMKASYACDGGKGL